METTVNTEILRSRVDTFVLSALNEHDGYGYDILNYIHSKTKGHYEMKQSSIYSVLKRLEKQGLISSYMGDESNGARRRYYRLTEQGKEFLEAEQKEWAYARTLLDNLVTDMNFDLETDTPPFKPSDLRPMTKRTKSDEDFDDDTPEEKHDKDASAQLEVVQPVKPYVTSPIIVPVINISSPTVPTSTTPTSEPALGTTNNMASAISTSQESLIKNEKETSSIVIEEKKSEETAPRLRLNDLIDQKLAEKSHRDSDFSDKNKDYEQISLFESSLTKALRNPSERPIKSKATYTDVLSHLFDKDTVETEEKTTLEVVQNQERITTEASATPIRPIAEEVKRKEILSSIETGPKLEDIKNNLRDDGFTVKAYNKKEAESTEYMKFIYINRINRDISIICYLFFVVELLILYLTSEIFQYSGKTLLTIGLCGLIVPAITLFIYLLNPNRRVKSRFNFKMSLGYAMLTFITIFMLNLIISLVVSTISLTMKDAKLYPPIILSLPIILWVVLYQVFYNLKIYHIKNKL